MDKLIWLQRDQQLHRLTLEHADLGAGVSAAVTYLSGPDLARINLQDLVTLSGNHTISGHKDFGVVKVNSLVVSGTSESATCTSWYFITCIEFIRFTNLLLMILLFIDIFFTWLFTYLWFYRIWMLYTCPSLHICNCPFFL